MPVDDDDDAGLDASSSAQHIGGKKSKKDKKKEKRRQKAASSSCSPKTDSKGLSAEAATSLPSAAEVGAGEEEEPVREVPAAAAMVDAPVAAAVASGEDAEKGVVAKESTEEPGATPPVDNSSAPSSLPLPTTATAATAATAGFADASAPLAHATPQRPETTYSESLLSPTSFFASLEHDAPMLAMAKEETDSSAEVVGLLLGLLRRQAGFRGVTLLAVSAILQRVLLREGPAACISPSHAQFLQVGRLSCGG